MYRLTLQISPLFLCLLICLPLIAQEKKPPPEGWETGAGLGFDFLQLLQINPKQGAGQNRIGVGTASNFYANHRRGRHRWENKASWQFGLQRIGSGTVQIDGEEIGVPFQKSIDELRLSTKYGFQTGPESRFSYAASLAFLSQVLPAYEGPADFPGNFLSDVFNTGLQPLSRFFSPATIMPSVGISCHVTDGLALFFSPVGGKFIIVANDSIAARGVHGNPVERNASGAIVSFDKVDGQFGSLLRADFTDKFFEKKMAFTSHLTLYSNYLNNPENIDVDWNNQLDYILFKNFSISLMLNIFYDDDVLVQITDFNQPNGVRGLGRRVNITQQFLFKYSVVF